MIIIAIIAVVFVVHALYTIGMSSRKLNKMFDEFDHKK